MNKTIILSSAIVFEMLGNYLPILFGETDIFSVWGIIGGLIGGLFGVWIGVKLSKRFSGY